MNRTHHTHLARRLFLGGLAAAGAAAATPSNPNNAADTEADRTAKAYQLRVDAARLERDAPITPPVNNGDEELYANKIGNYSKGLPHNDAGEVDVNAYAALLNACATGLAADFEAITMGS